MYMKLKKRENRSFYLQNIAWKFLQMLPFFLLLTSIAQANQREEKPNDGPLSKSSRSQIFEKMEDGRLYMEIGDYTEARKLFKRALELSIQYQDTVAQAISYLDQGVNEVRDGKLRKGQSSLLMALELEDYLEEENIFRLHAQLGRFYLLSGQANPAVKHFSDAIPMLDTLERKRQAASLWIKVGEIYLDQIFDPAQALHAFKRGLELLDGERHNSLALGALMGLARASQEIGDSLIALDYARQSIQIRTAMESQPGMDHPEIALLHYHYEDAGPAVGTKNGDSDWESILVILGGGLIFSLLLGTYQLYQLKNHERLAKIDRILSEQRILVTHKHLRELKQNYQSTAEDLHDRIGAILSTAKVFMDAIDFEDEGTRVRDGESFMRVRELLNKGFEEIRTITDNIHLEVSLGFGFKRYLQEYVHRLGEVMEIHGEVFIHGFDEEIELEKEKHISTLIHALIADVCKYSRAHHMSIQLNQFDKLVNIIVEDDGLGSRNFFPLPGRKASLGNIANRTDDLGGLMKTDRKKGRGTVVSIDLPEY